MTKNIEKLAEAGERLLMKEMEKRYLHLRKVATEFLEAKEKGIENKAVINKTLLFGPIALPISETPKSRYAEALIDYRHFAQYLEGFGLSVGHMTINVNSYEEALKK